MYEHYRYDVIGADLDYGVNGHPQKVMKELGYNIVRSMPFPIADCWIFRVSNHVDPIEPYLTRLDDNFEFFDER